MSLFKAVGKRLFFALISLVFLSFITFVADEVAPGDRATVEAGEKGTQADVERLRRLYGLERPWPVRFGEFLGNAARLDFGESYEKNEPVRDTIARDLPMTLTIAGMALLFAGLIGITAGSLAGIWRERWVDRLVLVGSTLGVTLPTFVLAPLFVLVFTEKLDQLPGQWTTDRVAPDIFYLIMPVLVLAARPTAQITRLTRASMIDTLQQEFIKLATAKGVPPFRLYVRHALRNAILPVVTALGVNFGFLLTGSFIVERAFLLPGLGREGIEAIQKGDTPLIQATVLLAGAMFVLVNFIVDAVAPMLDPRIREAQI